MIVKRIFLEEDNPEAWIDACIADPVRGFTRRAMLVIPGGGYGAVCSDREGEPIALAFMAEGFNAFVLHYTVGRKKPYPAQLREASLAMAHIRTHAEEYGVDPHRVFTVGFSAGGHLAGSLAVLWHREEAWKDTGIEYGQNRPDGAVLVYPVVSGAEYFREGGTFSNLWCCDRPSEEELKTASLELAVDERTAPLFLVHTSDDPGVDVRNSLLLASACRAKGLPFELHVYPHGPHGVALGNDITACGNPGWSNPRVARWVKDAAAWAEEIGAD